MRARSDARRIVLRDYAKSGPTIAAWFFEPEKLAPAVAALSEEQVILYVLLAHFAGATSSLSVPADETLLLRRMGQDATHTRQHRRNIQKLAAAKLIKIERSATGKRVIVLLGNVPEPDPAKWEGPHLGWALLAEPGLSWGAKYLFCRLDWYWGTNGRAIAKHDTIAKSIGCSSRSVRRYQSELETYGVLDVKSGRRHNTYHALSHAALMPCRPWRLSDLCERFLTKCEGYSALEARTYTARIVAKVGDPFLDAARPSQFAPLSCQELRPYFAFALEQKMIEQDLFAKGEEAVA